LIPSVVITWPEQQIFRIRQSVASNVGEELEVANLRSEYSTSSL